MPALDTLRHVKHRLQSSADDAGFVCRRVGRALAASLRGGSTSSPDRIVISTDLNPEYLFAIPLTVLFWNRLFPAATVTIVAIGSAEAWAATPASKQVLATIREWSLRADMLHVTPRGLLATGHLAQVMRIWASTRFPGEFCLLSDGDLIPLDRSFYRLPRDPMHALFLLNADAYAPQERWCMAYVVADGNTWRAIAGDRTAAEAERVFAALYRELTPDYSAETPATSGRAGWFNDETILARLIREWNGYPSRCTFIRSYGYCRRRRLNRSAGEWRQFSAHSPDCWVDAHLFRRSWETWDAVEPVIRAMLPDRCDAVRRYAESWRMLEPSRTTTTANDNANSTPDKL